MPLMETGEGTFFLLVMTEGIDIGRAEVFTYAKKCSLYSKKSVLDALN
jgi:Na+-translocating ferredoxin:NAD+ oxidoreductase RnfE subunit